MNNVFLTPSDTIKKVIKTGEKKGNTPAVNVFILGVLAGIFIGLAYVGYMAVTQTLSTFDKGLAKFMGASVFPVGIMLVLFVGGSLFTGNNLITTAYLDKKITLMQVLKNWVVVWIGNLVGCIFIAYVVYFAGVYDSTNMREAAVHLAEHKASLTFTQALLSGFLCNLLVALGVWMSYTSEDLTAKILAAWFPVMLFVLSGYEHSVANMFCLNLGKILSPEIYNLSSVYFSNLLPVTIGNALSGGVFIPFVYYFLYGQKKTETVNKELKEAKA